MASGNDDCRNQKRSNHVNLSNICDPLRRFNVADSIIDRQRQRLFRLCNHTLQVDDRLFTKYRFMLETFHLKFVPALVKEILAVTSLSP